MKPEYDLELTQQFSEYINENDKRVYHLKRNTIILVGKGKYIGHNILIFKIRSHILDYILEDKIDRSSLYNCIHEFMLDIDGFNDFIIGRIV